LLQAVGDLQNVVKMGKISEIRAVVLADPTKVPLVQWWPLMLPHVKEVVEEEFDRVYSQTDQVRTCITSTLLAHALLSPLSPPLPPRRRHHHHSLPPLSPPPTTTTSLITNRRGSGTISPKSGPRLAPHEPKEEEEEGAVVRGLLPTLAEEVGVGEAAAAAAVASVVAAAPAEAAAASASAAAAARKRGLARVVRGGSTLAVAAAPGPL
jgi:hypothetical protein